MLSILALTACAGSGAPERNAVNADKATVEERQLLDVSRLLVDGWTELQLNGRTEYHLAVWEGKPVLRAVGNHSASGLIRAVDVDINECPFLEWLWKVDSLQPSADIRKKTTEDVAASIFLLIGDPGMLIEPRPVPTLRYVWSSKLVPAGSIVDNPYMPGVVKSVVVRAGRSRLGTWIRESRNVRADFERAFGQAPPDSLRAVAIFTDNDQTSEPVEALYGGVWSRCGEGK